MKKLFKCWYLKDGIGWIVFEKLFTSMAEARRYCEKKTDYKGSSIVEEVK